MKPNIDKIKILREITGLSLEDCLDAIKQSDNNVDRAIEYLRNNKKITQENHSILTSRRSNQEPIICPKCGSQSISMNKRGFKYTTAFFGMNKMLNTCQNCGFQWNPKK